VNNCYTSWRGSKPDPPYFGSGENNTRDIYLQLLKLFVNNCYTSFWRGRKPDPPYFGSGENNTRDIYVQLLKLFVKRFLEVLPFFRPETSMFIF
jgi:hypothetical protein